MRVSRIACDSGKSLFLLATAGEDWYFISYADLRIRLFCLWPYL